MAEKKRKTPATDSAVAVAGGTLGAIVGGGLAASKIAKKLDMREAAKRRAQRKVSLERRQFQAQANKPQPRFSRGARKIMGNVRRSQMRVPAGEGSRGSKMFKRFPKAKINEAFQRAVLNRAAKVKSSALKGIGKSGGSPAALALELLPEKVKRKMQESLPSEKSKEIQRKAGT